VKTLPASVKSLIPKPMGSLIPDHRTRK
jgi:hypothetical protein